MLKTVTENGALYLLSKRERRRRSRLIAVFLAVIRGVDWVITLPVRLHFNHREKGNESCRQIKGTD